MSRHHKLLIVGTFCMGLLTGVFGFFMSGGVGSVYTSDEITSGYDISVTQYGACEQSGCPSYRLDHRGAYEYLAPQENGTYERFSDVLTNRAQDTMVRLVSRTDFASLEIVSREERCGVGGEEDFTAYHIDIRVQDHYYALTACGESESDDPLIAELVAYNEIFRATYERQ